MHFGSAITLNSLAKSTFCTNAVQRALYCLLGLDRAMKTTGTELRVGNMTVKGRPLCKDTLSTWIYHKLDALLKSFPQAA